MFWYNMLGIYSIINTLSTKKYIGQAAILGKRLRDHLSALRRSVRGNSYLQRAFNKYGESAFVFNPILICEKSDLTYYEQKCMDIFGAEYNLAPAAGSLAGYKHPSEFGEKISLALIGRSPNLETRRRMRLAKLGRKFTYEHCINIGKGHKGQVPWNKGKHCSLEHRENLRVSHLGNIPWNKGKSLTLEQCENIGGAHRGLKYTHSVDYLQKHSRKILRVPVL